MGDRRVQAAQLRLVETGRGAADLVEGELVGQLRQRGADLDIVAGAELAQQGTDGQRFDALPAQLAGCPERGTLQVGSPADIVVYDYENLSILPPEVVHDMPGGEWRRVQRASGYRYVLINGEVTIENDSQTETYSGELLRHGRSSRKRERTRSAA